MTRRTHMTNGTFKDIEKLETESDERKRQLLSYSQKGSTREALNKEMIAGFEITLPREILTRQFGEIAAPSFRQREVLALQNQKLRAARNLLLPRLMSGEIAV